MFISTEPIFEKNEKILKKMFFDFSIILGTSEFAFMGGSISSKLFKKEIRDFDIFMGDLELFLKTKKNLMEKGWKIKAHRDHSFVFYKEGEFEIDLILIENLGNTESLVKSLVKTADFTAASVAYGLDGYAAHKDFSRDFINKNLRENNMETHPVSDRRLKSYLNKGFNIDPIFYNKVIQKRKSFNIKETILI